MADGGTRAMVEKLRRRLVGFDGAIAVVGILALIIGFFVGTRTGWLVCGLASLSAIAYLAVAWWQERAGETGGDDQNREEAYPQSPEGNMKKLLFDDFQSSEGEYVVRVVDEERTVVPSTKQAQPAPLPLQSESMRELEILDFFDLDTEASIAEAEPRAEFHSLMNKVLIVLKDVLFAHTAAFFWVNREKQQLVPEGWATDSGSFLSERFGLAEDLLSRVAAEQKPRLIGRMDPAAESETLRYYSAPQGIRSVVAVPVFFKGTAPEIETIGVLVADSVAEDSFGQETLLSLGHVTKLVSSLIKSYNDKYDLLLDAELMNSLKRMQDRIRSDPKEETIFAAIVDESNRIARWDAMAIVTYADDGRGWVVQKSISRSGAPYIPTGQVIDLKVSVVADAIRTNEVQNVPDVAAAGVVRYAEGEAIDSAGALICIPISSVSRCYGAVVVESRDTRGFSAGDEGNLYRLVEIAASALEVRYMNDVVREHVVVDPQTGSMTRRHFLKRLEDEVRRAEDFRMELSLVVIAVDGLTEHASRYGKEAVDVILNELTRVVRANLRTYDAVGHLDEDRLGVLLVHMAASEAYLWAERVRKLVSSHVLTMGGRNFSVTVTLGVCGASEGMRAEEIVTGAGKVLQKAIEGGGNLVRVY
jgi:diguanylate cyclase (GGDEF)-like protein